MDTDLGSRNLGLGCVGSARKASATFAAGPDACADSCHVSSSIADGASMWSVLLEFHLAYACSEGAAISGTKSAGGFDNFSLCH